MIAFQLEISATSAASISAAIVLIMGAFFAGIKLIITTLKETKTAIHSVDASTVATQVVVAASAEASRTRGVVRDGKIQEIHVLVNSRVLSILRMIVFLTKKEALRTNLPDDKHAYEEALSELSRAEAAASIISSTDLSTRIADENQANEADRKLNILIAATSGAKRVDDLNKHLLSLDKKES